MRQANEEAQAFLDSRNFRTSWGNCALKATKRYHDGRKECEDYEEIYISINNTVSARLKNGGTMNGYERIGYHAYTDEYLRAILDSGCPVFVYRVASDGSIQKYDLCELQRQHTYDLEIERVVMIKPLPPNIRIVSGPNPCTHITGPKVWEIVVRLPVYSSKLAMAAFNKLPEYVDLLGCTYRKGGMKASDCTVYYRSVNRKGNDDQDNS